MMCDPHQYQMTNFCLVKLYCETPNCVHYQIVKYQIVKHQIVKHQILERYLQPHWDKQGKEPCQPNQ